jgi:hypothetical protein
MKTISSHQTGETTPNSIFDLRSSTFRLLKQKRRRKTVNSASYDGFLGCCNGDRVVVSNTDLNIGSCGSIYVQEKVGNSSHLDVHRFIILPDNHSLERTGDAARFGTKVV